jgi:hypothetical protein
MTQTMLNNNFSSQQKWQNPQLEMCTSNRRKFIRCTLSETIDSLEDTSEPMLVRRAPTLTSLSSMSSMTSCSNLSEWSEMDDYMNAHWASPCPAGEVSASPLHLSHIKRCVGRKRSIFSKYWEKAGAPMAFRPAQIPEDMALLCTGSSSITLSPTCPRRTIFVHEEAASHAPHSHDPTKMLMSEPFLPLLSPVPLSRTPRVTKSLASLPTKDASCSESLSASRRSCLRRGRFSFDDIHVSSSTDDDESNNHEDEISISEATTHTCHSAVTFSKEVEVNVYDRPCEFYATEEWASFFSA